MPRLAKLLAVCLVALLLMSCAPDRGGARPILPSVPPPGPSCTSPASSACPVCTVQCLKGQREVCSAGQSVGGTCTVQPSCKCAGAS
jgi:hypothetical protein